MPIHVFFTGTQVEVWLDTKKGEQDGLCIGFGESRAFALHEALATLTEAMKETCEEVIPTSDVIQL